MRRWLFTWRHDAAPAPKPDKLERQALDDLNSAVPRRAPFKPAPRGGIEVIEGNTRVDNMVWAISLAQPISVFCGVKACGARHLEPLADYSSTAHFVCPKCRTLNIKKPLRSLTDPEPEAINNGVWGQLPARRKASDKMT